MTDADVHTALTRWIASVTGLVTMQAYQNIKEPALPYIMVNMMGTAEVHDRPSDIDYQETETENSEGELEVLATPIIDGEWRFSVHAYGSSPTSYLRKLKTAAKLNQKQEPLFPNLVIHELSQIRHVPEWIKNAWQPRAQIDVIVRGVVADGYVVDVIDQAPVTIETA